MNKVMLLSALIISAISASGQTDVEIANALLGQPYAQTNAILSKMGLWYHYHFRETKTASGDDVKPKYYSIENNGATKVWILKYNKEKVIEEITVNYRHDDRKQVEEAQRIAAQVDDYHVGTYSTDIVFRWKR